MEESCRFKFYQKILKLMTERGLVLYILMI